MVERIYVSKKDGYDVEAIGIKNDLCENLGIKGIKKLKVYNRYDVEGITKKEFDMLVNTVFAEPPVDEWFFEDIKTDRKTRLILIEYLPGQYDQRADSAAQCIQIITCREKPLVKTASIIAITGDISDCDYKKIKEYLINPVESREAPFDKPETLIENLREPDDVEILNGFINYDKNELKSFLQKKGLAMSYDDLSFCQEYFKEEEKRDPSITEIKVLDTYWSDHCRHTTFLTNIENVEIEKGRYSSVIKEAYEQYMLARDEVYKGRKKPVCLMDIATIAAKKLRQEGKLDDLELSDEINACSIEVDVDTGGGNEKWLVMFKNETHNHPTEIEPFGGAATCLGGAIRDPLSGRAYVYQAMRVTGSADPRQEIKDTIPGKLPQGKITREAAHGYSSYGNQIGLATGQVDEVYDPDFVAKRMEIGAVIAAAPKENVKRLGTEPGDSIILLGGRTGRDGCGGATGSSKEHDEESILKCGAEVQKGNPVTERKIQRLFRDPKVSKMIKKCNDFGAGGVSVAIGELAPGLDIDLDLVLKKYQGLDGTELAISESQERMAVVVDRKDEQEFIEYARQENLEAVLVAKVKKEARLKMKWRGKYIVDISRAFLNTNGAVQKTAVKVAAPNEYDDYFDNIPIEIEGASSIDEAVYNNMARLENCSRKGLVEMFDSTVGAGTVLMPFGGKFQLSPQEGMAARIPVLDKETDTATIMTYGYNPKIGKWSPFHGAAYAVIESLAKLVCMGGNIKKARLTLQEYFEKPGKDEKRWGKPFAALLGAYYVQNKLSIPAIGGKDSMSGTFKDIDVPPTLVSFAVTAVKAGSIISAEIKSRGNMILYIPAKYDEMDMPDLNYLEEIYSKIHSLIKKGIIRSAKSVGEGGTMAALFKMAAGNKTGIKFDGSYKISDAFKPFYGSIIIEVENKDLGSIKDLKYDIIGKTISSPVFSIGKNNIKIDDIIDHWGKTLEKVFPTKAKEPEGKIETISKNSLSFIYTKEKTAKPRVFIPVFPGTNCEYESKKAFEKAGAGVELLVMKNIHAKDVEESVDKMERIIKNSQIIMIPGGFSAGDEPEGSGKFITAVFKNPKIKEAVMDLMNNRDGLMLGICNGFQALIKLGLVPYGEIRDIDEHSPTLTFNNIGRHVSCIIRTRIASNMSPWFNNVKTGDVHSIPVSHGEGRFTADEEWIERLIKNDQIATQYVDFKDEASNDIRYNPNGSVMAIEGITSPDGRILGKMAHSERIAYNTIKNVPGEKDQKLFLSGVEYFK